MTDRDLAHWLTIIQGEYAEMPGLHLTKPQVQRLWGLDSPTCDLLMETLQRRHVLRMTPRGCYALDDSMMAAKQSSSAASSELTRPSTH